MVNFYLGFDPGGSNTRDGAKFGWSICAEVDDGLTRLKTDLADHACDAVEQVGGAIESYTNVRVQAAGIDAPLRVHKRKGNRNIDQNLRDALTRKKFPGSVSGTVQAVNRLQGAATVQGGLLVLHLVEKPWAQDMIITESHPKAFRYLLSHTGQPDDLVKTVDCLTKELITCEEAKNHTREECKRCDQDSHKVDATLCAIAAWAATKTPPLSNWCDLYKQEYRIAEDGTKEDVLIPLFQIPESTNLSYWMPMPR